MERFEYKVIPYLGNEVRLKGAVIKYGRYQGGRDLWKTKDNFILPLKKIQNISYPMNFSTKNFTPQPTPEQEN